MRKGKETAAVSGVAAADRVLTVLTAFQKGDGAVELAELAERTGLVKSTIMRLTVSLERFGLVVRLPGGRYRLGAEALRLGAVYQHSLEIEPFVMPILERLAAETGETASFYAPHGKNRICLYRVDSMHNLRLHVQPGDIRPMDQSAISQVLREFAKGAGSATSLEPPVYSGGITDPHVASLAMPAFGSGQRLIGALAISGPITRLTADRAQQVRAQLRDGGLELTRSLGGDRPQPLPAKRL